jgi:hypothetical protein
MADRVQFLRIESRAPTTADTSAGNVADDPALEVAPSLGNTIDRKLWLHLDAAAGIADVYTCTNAAAGTWNRLSSKAYTPADADALAAITGMREGDIAVQTSPAAAYVRGPSSWVEMATGGGGGAVSAADVSFAPAGDIAATNVQAAIVEVRDDTDTKLTGKADTGHTHATLPTADEKAALAGTSGAPATGNRYVTDGDARMSNARTPTAHAASHATGGADALTPSAIGAVPVARTVASGTGLSGGGDLSTDRTLSVDYGSTAGTAAQGNDARLSDARTPTAHAASHATGGGDAITPASIGADTAGTARPPTAHASTHAAGGADVIFPVSRLVTANTTILVAEDVIRCAHTADLTLTLPVSPPPDKSWTIAKEIANAFTITIARTGTETIQGVAANFLLPDSDSDAFPAWTLYHVADGVYRVY